MSGKAFGPLSARASGPPDERERGYALVAAVASVAVFAAIALAVIRATQIDIVKGGGEISSARARLAAEAGMATALHGLINRDPATLALLDGRTQGLDFGGVRLKIALIDERGKVALNAIEAPAIDRMLSEAGMDLAQTEVARDSLLDWIDEDDEARPGGAEAPYYAKRGIAPRNSGLLTIDELGAIRGFSPQVIARLRPFVTVQPGAVPFSPRYASPQALNAYGNSGGAVTEIERQREATGQRTAIAFADQAPLIGRPITISVDAAMADGAHHHSDAVVEMSGKPAHPYIIRTTR